MRTLFSIVLWIYWTVCIVAFLLIVTLLFLLTFPFDRFRQIPNKAVKGLAFVMMRANPCWHFDIQGASGDKINRPTIVVANHQSFLDMPLAYMLPWNMKWLAKKSLLRIPLLGWIISMTGHIGIDRHSRRSVKKLDKLVSPIKSGIPAMIFPEGTRTMDGELKSFKNGAFVLAKQYNFRVLPVVLKGGYEAMPAGSWKVKARQRFTIAVLDPLNPEEFESAEDLKKSAFEQIRAELN